MPVANAIALVTGATAGIGRAIAVALAAEGWRLILTGRRQERLAELSRELGEQTPILPLAFDVRDREAVNRELDKLPDDWREIDLLVNNAGLSRGLDYLDQGDVQDWEEMIDTNVKGLLYVTRAVVPGMRERGRGQVINVGSTAAKEVYPKGGVYCATKHAVDALTTNLRMDLLGSGVTVGAIHPALTETEFSNVRFRGDTERASRVYADMEPLQPEDVADAVVFMTNRPPHVNVADLVLMPRDQAASTMVHRHGQGD